MGEPWRLWFEGRWSFIWGVGLTLAIAGSRAAVASKWLDIRAPKHPDVMARAKRASEVHAVRHLAPTPIVPDDLRWLQTRRTVQDEVRRAFPPPSPGRFFAKGWRANGPGQLAFVEWFLDLTSRPGNGTMWIIDPYFDTAGVVELLGKSRATQRIYRVLTNTQIPSDDDALDPTSTSRAKRLVQACRSSQLLLGGQLDFELWDLQSANKKLHDRYILIYGGNDCPEEGYHLSNSLQYATENTPLLITPIPSDILGDVAEYVQDLLRDPSDTRCLLFTSRVTQTQHRENLTSGYNASPFLFSVWLEERCLRHASPAKVLKQLLSRGLANPWNVPQLRKHIGALARGLASADSSKFRPLWSAFAEWLAHVPTKDVSACLDDLMQLGGNDISPKLVNFLNQAFSDVSA